MSSILMVTTDLANVVRKVLDGYTVTDGDGSTSPVVVREMHLKWREMDDEKLEHYVIVRPMEGEDDDTDSRATFGILCRIRDTNPDKGVQSLVNLLERIRTALLTSYGVGWKFRIIRPMQWALSENDNLPYHSGYLTVTVGMYSPQPSDIKTII